MKTSTIVWVVVVIIIIAGGAWYFYSNNSATVAPSGQTVSTNNVGGSDQTGGGGGSEIVAMLGTSATLGSYVTAKNGMTLYTYANDSAGVSNCTGQCATNWPPYSVAAGTPLSGDTGVTGQFSTITRADGTTQVTYNGKPLYFYVKDVAPGDATGQGVGGVWQVATP